MNSFFKDVISHLLKNAFEGHTKFSVADDTAVGANPVRSISLDAVPVNNDVLISLSWDGGEKLFEKTLSEQEASHQFDLISTDLAEVAALTKQGEYDSAKALMKKLGQKYAENTGDIVDTNLPKLHNTQASKEDSRLWKQAKITMQNLWFSTNDELLEYQQKQKGAKPGNDQDHIPLWDKTKKEKSPESMDKGLAPASLSYEDVENQKEREHEDMQKHIDEKIKTELESALQEKAASVFGPDQIELVKVLRKNGRNWDEIKKILIKDFNFDKEATTIFIDEQRESMDPTGIDVEPVKEEPKGPEEKSPLTPPEDLVSPETHDKLLQDHEDKKKDETPLENKEPSFTPKDVMDIPEDDEIVDQSSLSNEIARADNDDIHKVAAKRWTGDMDKDLQVLMPHIVADGVAPDRELSDWLVNYAKAIYKNNADWGKMIAKEDNNSRDTLKSFMEHWMKAKAANPNLRPELHTQSSLKTAAPSDLNPLQEPIEERPTAETSTPQQDLVPMGKKPLDHNAPQKGDRVFVSSDMTDEKAGFEATYISNYQAKGVDFSIVETDAGDLIDIETNRVVKTSEGTSGAQDTEPVAEPQIEKPQETDIPVTPKMDDFHTSEQESALTIKAEVEALLKEVEGMAKTSYIFIKQGLEKHADDSAFEGNGWCRVWVQEDELASDNRYPEILKLADENSKIAALKDLARELAHEALRLADSASSKVGVQSWFESLKPSDHDRIDWVKLANPQTEEQEMAEFNKDMGYESSQNKMFMKKGELPPEHICEQCKKPMGYQGFLGPVCEKCVRKNHKKVTGSDFEKGISQNKTSDETLPAAKSVKKNPSLKDKDIDPYKHHSDLEWETGDPCKLCKSPIDDNCQCTNAECEFHRCGQAYAATKPEGSEPDQVDLIMAYETGELDDAGILKLFSMLIKSGDAWSLQGSYGRTAKALIEAGYINDRGTITKDVVDTEVVPEQKMLSKQYAFNKVTKKANQTSKEDYIAYLTQTLIPDMKESGTIETAKDFQTIIKLLKSGKQDPSYVEWLLNTLIPDLADSGKMATAEDLLEGIFWMTGEQHPLPESENYDSEGFAKNYPGMADEAAQKTAAEPEVAPKTQFKDYKITPKYAPKEQAVPATPEIDQVLSKMDALQQNLATLETARKQIQAKMKEEMDKIDQQGERAQMEAALQESIEKAAVLIDAVESKVVQWKDKLFTMQTEQVDLVPGLTPKEMLAKIYAKFEGAEKYVQDVLNGMLSQAKRVVEKTLIRWPNKKSSLDKSSSLVDDMNHYNEELMAALKLLSEPM